MNRIIKALAVLTVVAGLGACSAAAGPATGPTATSVAPPTESASPVTATPVPPPLNVAKVDGKYTGPSKDVSCTFSDSDCEQASSHQTIVWDFSAEKKGTLLHSLTGKYYLGLKDSGHGYTGSDPDGDYARTIKFHVVKAQDVGGVWTATKVKGTLRTEWLPDPQYYTVTVFTVMLQS